LSMPSSSNGMSKSSEEGLTIPRRMIEVTRSVMLKPAYDIRRTVRERQGSLQGTASFPQRLHRAPSYYPLSCADLSAFASPRVPIGYQRLGGACAPQSVHTESRPSRGVVAASEIVDVAAHRHRLHR